MKYGLIPKKRDKRTFKYSVAFGAVDELPTEDFEFPTLGVKDQWDTDFCAAFSSTLVSEMQEGVELSPSFSFAAGKKISGDLEGFGCGLIDMAKGHCKIGALEEKDCPITMKPSAENRPDIINIENWSDSLRVKASEHAKKSYFDITLGSRDPFDCVRSALWKNYQYWKKGGKPEAAFTGFKWHNWGDTNGIIPRDYDKGFGYHAVAIIGQKMINGEPYLIIQNSYGKNSGDNGRFYMPREVFNRETKWGLFERFEALCFVDMDKNEAKELSQQTLLQLIIEKLKKVVYLLQRQLGKFL